MEDHRIVTRIEWIEARKQLLSREKDFTLRRDELSRQRRELPWVRVDKEYVFQGPEREETLADLFEGRTQLIVYHFMFGPDWEAGCKSCSFWADQFAGLATHLNQRDITLAAVSKAGMDKLQAYRNRLGWRFKWVSSSGNDFNHDYHVSFTAEEINRGEVFYNFQSGKFSSSELPGISVFCKNANGAVFHTYSCYARGLDMLNGAYQYMDLVPKGRDEHALSYPMAWVRRHDEYGE